MELMNPLDQVLAYQNGLGTFDAASDCAKDLKETRGYWRARKSTSLIYD